MTPMKAPLWLAYLITLGIIVGTWLTTTLTQNGTQFDSLGTQKALGSLTLLVIGWLVGCGVHFKATGDPSPITPPAAAIAGELLSVPAAAPVVVNNYWQTPQSAPVTPPLPPA